MAPGFELMGWLKQAGAQTVPPVDAAAQPGTAAAPAGQVANTAPGAGPPSRIVAPHSQAAAALAAALCAGGLPEKKHPQPHGTPIPPHQDVVEVDRIWPESGSSLMVSKIANYPSEVSRRHGHSIAVDTNYICYGLKGGQIRILNRHTAARTLLKDHAAPVTDLRFFRHDSERCLLASVDTTGQVHVRKVYEEDADGEDTVRDEILARHELPIPTSGPTAHPPARLAWHPNYDFVLAVAAGPIVYLINVPPTADVAAAPEYLAPVAAAHSTDGAVMTSVAFSPSGDLLAAGDAHGFVYIWALTSEQLDPALIQPLAPEPDIRFQAYGSAPGEAPYGDGTVDSVAVVSLSWLSRSGKGGLGTESMGCGVGGAGGYGAPHVLLTGDGVNAHLRLWTIDLSSKPQCTHAIQLASGTTAASAAFFNHLEVQVLYDCIILANELRNHVYVLHVDVASQSHTPTFDYISEFSVKMPILSCTLVPEVFEDEATGAKAFHMYTIQSDAVQQYTIVPAQCFPMLPVPGTAVSVAAPGGSTASAAGSTAGHYSHHAAGGVGGSTAGGAADSSAGVRLSKDLLASLLSFQQQQRQLLQQQQQEKGRELSPPQVHNVTSPISPTQQPQGLPSALVGMPSDVSDATSPPLPGSGGGALTGAEEPIAADRLCVTDAAASEQVHAGKAEAEAAPLATAVDADAAGVESLDAAVAAAAAEAGAAAVQEAEVLMQTATAEPLPQPAVVRPSFLLTPSQLMQSAAAAAASARSVASSSASTPAPGVSNATQTQDELRGTAVAVAAAALAATEPDTVASTAGTSRSQSLANLSNALTPSLSDANLVATSAAAEVAAAAEVEAEAAAARADLEEADAVTAAASVKALPASSSAPLPGAVAVAGPQQFPASMPPPLPSDMLMRQTSKDKTSPTASHPNPLSKWVQLTPQPIKSSPFSPGATAAAATSMLPVAAAPTPMEPAGAGAEERVVAEVIAAAAPTVGAVPAAVPGVSMLSLQAQQHRHQQALAQLMELQQQLLEQVSAGQREMLKAIRAEAQRTSKAAVDAAAMRAAEAVARKAAEERRKENMELQRALTGAINHVSKELSQRVSDAAAATTAAVKASIGPAVRAAVAEALPAALSAGGTAAALERALGSQLSASLPRAVADGLGAAFTAQVVPPLERATSTMFGQMESALRAGLDSHLAPLGPLASLGNQLRDAAAQVQSAAKIIKSEAATTQQAAAAAARAAAAVAAVPQPQPLQPVAASVTSAVVGAPKGSTKTAAPPAPGPSRSVTSEVSTATSTAVTVAAVAAASATRAAAAAAAAAHRSQPALTQHTPASAPSSARGELSQAVVTTPPPPVMAAPTAPAPAVDATTKNAVQGLIRTGDLDGALSRVLEGQDLSLVLWACAEAGGASILVAEPCPLGQATLLSLLTFLSYDLTADVDLKLGWIDAILKRLDVREPGLAPHIRGVLDRVKVALAVIARGGTGATAAKAKQAVHQAIGLIAMLS